MLVTMYSPEGEPFEVLPVIARDLRKKGWTANPHDTVAPISPYTPAERPTPVIGRHRRGPQKVVEAAPEVGTVVPLSPNDVLGDSTDASTTPPTVLD